ncbi:hypothetical protein [Marinobacterium iners]|uniref:Uncharacterized protein n=1 Tax=Marinobacterium iners DSM 11526 TaxID=1122198 RepID=A0A1H3ZW81_9GAMM|nr:hypothetical protein [Marinobacterium iners]SEA28013.1 hypothetical protein SAMN02745729_102191 [Marinobacterium iners DSM 11526]
MRLSHIALALLLLSNPALADVLCDSPASSIAHNKTNNEILALAQKKDPDIKKILCGVLTEVNALEKGYTAAPDYENAVVIAENYDQRFQAIQRLSDITLFRHEFNGENYPQFVMADTSWHQGEELQAGPYRVLGVQKFTSANGFPVQLLILELFQFY